MFRLQTPLPGRYTDATDDELEAMIGAAAPNSVNGSSSSATTTSTTR